MSTWKGNIKNPAPNSVQEPIDRSEKIISDNRAEQVRRDTDNQKNFTISLYDIDETILTHLQNMDLQVEDVGKRVKVPIFFGSPERWTSAQRDGYIRDKQGKLILPAIILKRTSSESDSTLQFFNRYLNTPVMKMYSQKNQYTKFSLLAGQNAPVNEVYNVVVPNHMILTYHFIMWTEKVEQMNDLVSAIQFNTRDYWGSKRGFKFRTRVDTYSHAVEIQTGEDRVVKTEFDVVTHGYILPDSMTKLDKHEMTTKKMFTPKKIVMGAEVVNTGFDMDNLNSNREKWRNPNYPNLQADVQIPPPPVRVISGISDASDITTQIVGSLKSVTQSPIVDPISVGLDNTRPFLRIVPTPTTTAAGGEEGYVSYDDKYFYVFAGGGWKRVAISEFTQLPPCQEGTVSFNNKYFYLYSSGSWRQVAISQFS